MEKEIHLHQFDTLPQPGDIALVRGCGVGSRVLIRLQNLLGRDGDFSHVLICIGADLWCQAMPRKGVEIVTTAEAFLSEEGRPETVEVLRPPAAVARLKVLSINGDRDAMPNKSMEAYVGANFMANEWSAWLTVTMYFVGQSYNYLLLLGKWYLDRSKFCSELVAGVMAARKISPFVGRPQTAFAPNDLSWQNLRDHGWVKFTPQFEFYLASPMLPTSAKQAEQRETTKRSFVGLTAGTTYLGETFALSLQRQVKTININRLFPGNKALEPSLMRNLEERLTQANQHREQLQTVGVLRRGAPWIEGKNSYRRRTTAERDLKTAIDKADAFLKTHLN